MNSNKQEKEVEEILELCYMARSECRSKSCYFRMRLDLDELNEWESGNGIFK